MTAGEAEAVYKLAKDALQIQDASNLRGVILAWHKAICNDAVARGGQVEEFLNILYLSKVTSLLKAETDGIGSVTIPDVDDAEGRPQVVADFRMAYEWAERCTGQDW